MVKIKDIFKIAKRYTNKNWLYARPRKLDSSYLSNGRLNPAAIRCNKEPLTHCKWADNSAVNSRI